MTRSWRNKASKRFQSKYGEQASPDLVNRQAQRYDEWYRTALGSLCLEIERNSIFRLANIRSGEKVADLGCGTGAFTIEAARFGARIVGVDSSPEMLAVAASKTHGTDLPVSFLRGNMEKLPFSSESLDLVLAITTLCFVRRPESVISEAYRVLKPGGRLVIGELNRKSYWAWLRRTKGVFKKSVYRQARFFSASALDALLVRSGFRTGSVESHIFFPPLNSKVLLNQSRWFETTGNRFMTGRGAFLAVRGEKRKIYFI